MYRPLGIKKCLIGVIFCWFGEWASVREIPKGWNSALLHRSPQFHRDCGFQLSQTDRSLKFDVSHPSLIGPVKIISDMSENAENEQLCRYLSSQYSSKKVTQRLTTQRFGPLTIPSQKQSICFPKDRFLLKNGIPGMQFYTIESNGNETFSKTR
jgi:hypothetical protein